MAASFPKKAAAMFFYMSYEVDPFHALGWKLETLPYDLRVP
jgi:hypothetical protein